MSQVVLSDFPHVIAKNEPKFVPKQGQITSFYSDKLWFDSIYGLTGMRVFTFNQNSLLLRMSLNSAALHTQIRRRRSTFELVISALALSAIAAACQGPGQVSAAQRLVIADSLESLVKNAYDFSQPYVSQRLLSLYPDSGRVISAAAGRVTTTQSALATEIAGFWQRVGQNMKEPKFLIGSSYVDVLTADAAVMTFSYSIPHITPMGRPHTVAGAWTTLWRRQGGRWMIVQEHLSDTPESTMSSATIADSITSRDSTGHNMSGHMMPPQTNPPKR